MTRHKGFDGGGVTLASGIALTSGCLADYRGRITLNPKPGAIVIARSGLLQVGSWKKHMSYSLNSKYFPLTSPIILLCIIPYRTPLKEFRL